MNGPLLSTELLQPDPLLSLLLHWFANRCLVTFSLSWLPIDLRWTALDLESLTKEIGQECLPTSSFAVGSMDAGPEIKLGFYWSNILIREGSNL